LYAFTAITGIANLAPLCRMVSQLCDSRTGGSVASEMVPSNTTAPNPAEEFSGVAEIARMGMVRVLSLHTIPMRVIILYQPVQPSYPPISTPKTKTIRITFTVLSLETFICLSDFNPDDNNDRTIIQTCLGRIH
jgi:hypothetical protein